MRAGRLLIGGLRPARERPPTLREATSRFPPSPTLRPRAVAPTPRPSVGWGASSVLSARWSGFVGGSSAGCGARRGVACAGDVESPRGHRALVLGVLRALWVGGRAVRRGAGAPARARGPDQGDPVRPSSIGCGAATTPRCARRRCGGCCMRPRREPGGAVAEHRGSRSGEQARSCGFQRWRRLLRC